MINKKDVVSGIMNGIIISVLMFAIDYFTRSLNILYAFLFPAVVLIIEFIIMKYAKKSQKSIGFYIVSYLVPVIILLVLLYTSYSLVRY